MATKIKEVKNFKYGVVNAIEPESIPLGSFSDALNFITRGDKMELRRGYARVGQTDAGVGSVTGIGVGSKLDSVGTEVLFWTRLRKVLYYNDATDDQVEVGSNVLPAAASGEDVEFDSYQSQAGSQVFLSSPSSSIYKILTANPGSITDLASTVYRGYIRIKQSRMFLWNRNGASGSGKRDEQNIYDSYIDNRQYTTVSSEAITDLASATLAFKAAGSKRTCFGIVLTLTSSGEIFTDNRDGTLSGDSGGTGTINYTTGEVTTSVTGAGTADYQWEDSTSQGIADFTYSSPRTAAQGNYYLQGDGGPAMGVETYGDTEYCGHKRNIYALTLGSDDTNGTNLLFRSGEGIPNHRAIRATSIGIIYVNALDPGKPEVKLLSLQKGSTAVDGVVISQNLDLSGFVFDQCYIVEFDDFVGIGCRTTDSPVNNRLLLRSKVWKSWDIVEYFANCGTVLDGALVLGDSLSGNPYTAFSGVDDDGAAISGFAKMNIWNLDYAEYLKKCKKLHVEGDIGPDQVIDVLASLDRGPFVTIGQIKGSGNYVDKGQRVDVGSLTLGRGTVGGGSDGITAYHYFREIPLKLDRFENIELMFQVGVDAENRNADGIGYFSFSLVRPYDIRLKSQRPPRKYRN